jgi:hypothetical protein
MWRLTGGAGWSAAQTQDALAGGFSYARVGCSWAKIGSRAETRLAAHDSVKRFPIYLNPIFYLIQI